MPAEHLLTFLHDTTSNRTPVPPPGRGRRRPGRVTGQRGSAWPWAAGSSGRHPRRACCGGCLRPGRAEPHLRQRRAGDRDQHRGAGCRGTWSWPGCSLFAGCLVAVLLSRPQGRRDRGRHAGALRGRQAARQPSWPGRPGVLAGLWLWRTRRTRRTTPASPSRCGPTRCCSSGRRPSRPATSCASACSNLLHRPRDRGADAGHGRLSTSRGTGAAARKMDR